MNEARSLIRARIDKLTTMGARSHWSVSEPAAPMSPDEAREARNAYQRHYRAARMYGLTVAEYREARASWEAGDAEDGATDAMRRDGRVPLSDYLDALSRGLTVPERHSARLSGELHRFPRARLPVDA